MGRGFLPSPVRQSTIQLAPAERADIIVDFTGITPGTRLYLINEGPDEPFGGGSPGTDFEPADVRTTGQVMRFVVGTWYAGPTVARAAANRRQRFARVSYRPRRGSLSVR